MLLVTSGPVSWSWWSWDVVLDDGEQRLPRDPFSFATACSGGTAVTAGASALALNYTGVNTASPIDVSGSSSGSIVGTALTTPSVTTTVGNDDVVSLYETDASSLTGVTVSQGGSWSTSGAEDAVQTVAGASTAGSATSGSSAYWTGQTIALKPLLSSSITVTPPSGYAVGDLELVTIGVQNLGSTNHICAPTSSGTWSPVATVTSGSGATAVTQSTFWTTTSAPTPDIFSFATACSGGTAVTAGASALALNYTGIDTASPIDVMGSSSGSTAGTALTAPSVTTTAANDEVVNLYAAIRN